MSRLPERASRGEDGVDGDTVPTYMAEPPSHSRFTDKSRFRDYTVRFGKITLIGCQ